MKFHCVCFADMVQWESGQAPLKIDGPRRIFASGVRLPSHPFFSEDLEFSRIA